MASEHDDQTERRYGDNYSSHRPIPTIQKYRETKEKRRDNADQLDDDTVEQRGGVDEQKVLPQEERGRSRNDSRAGTGQDDHAMGDTDESRSAEDTSQSAFEGLDGKHKLKEIRKRRGDRATRDVTDPITHLPVTIHDLQDSDLRDIGENIGPPDSDHRTATGLSIKSKSSKQLNAEAGEMENAHLNLVGLFPPPEFNAIKKELGRLYSLTIFVGLASIALVFVLLFLLDKAIWSGSSVPEDVQHNSRRKSNSWWLPTLVTCLAISIALGVTIGVIFTLQKWTASKVDALWEDELWESYRRDEGKRENSNESTHWLNSMLSAVWPLVNPDLFTSLADTIEDVMQASLPSFIRMVSVDDIGQGPEALRVLGVRWLPTGAAGRTVSKGGKLSPRGETDQKNKDEGQGSDTKNSGDAGGNGEKHETEADEQEEEQENEGLQAEDGDFINLELALAYRATTKGSGFRDRARHLHMLIHFYFPGSIRIPVFVDLRGGLIILRLRLQLTPDPPFFGLLTFTFLGQPKVNLGCTALAKFAPNLMDLPLISSFVQSAVDAAMAEYVAPKSMTINLKDMLAGDDFKRDTRALGVIVVTIKRGYDFAEGDPGIPLIKKGSCDPFCTIGWSKLGKPIWSTRVMLKEMEPQWEETAFILVQAEPVNVGEALRIQLWDSDRLTADDDLGRIELDLKDLMSNDKTKGQMHERTDGFRALKAGEGMPGKLEWAVGFYEKLSIQEAQMKQQTFDSSLRSVQALKDKVRKISGRKLREAEGSLDETKEKEQLIKQNYKEVEDRMVCSTKPSDDYPSGILSIQIHQIVGLEMQHFNKSRDNDEAEQTEEQETGDDLPTSYCSLILNHQVIYRTRAKPKTSNPFFNASTERFIKDWRTAEIFCTVRDFRVHEDDALLGFIHLPLGKVFSERSQTSEFYPMVGGIGFGKVRISLVFRSVQLQAPRQLLGWEFGTLEVEPRIKIVDLPQDLRGLRLKLKTTVSKLHMWHDKSKESYVCKHDSKAHLAVRKRYSTCLTVELRKDTAIIDKHKTAAFCVLWLNDVVDDEKMTLELPVWKGDFKRATSCNQKECGERVGTLSIELTFRSGLGKYHHQLAKKDRHIKAIFEVLDAARDHNEEREIETKGGILRTVNEEDVDNESDASADSSDDEKHKHHHGGYDDEPRSTMHDNRDDNDSDGDSADSLQESGHRSLASAVKDYKKHWRQQHRQQRGIMQWELPRTAQWAKHKLDHGKSKLTGLLDHHENKAAIESEV